MANLLIMTDGVRLEVPDNKVEDLQSRMMQDSTGIAQFIDPKTKSIVTVKTNNIIALLEEEQ